MDLNYSVVTTVITIALCFKTISAKNLVQLTSDSPTTIGGTTTLFAKVVDCDGRLEGQTFRYTFEYFTGQIITVKASSYNFSISDWKSIGKHKVRLSVEKITNHNYRICGSDTTYVIITGLYVMCIWIKLSGFSNSSLQSTLLSCFLSLPNRQSKQRVCCKGDLDLRGPLDSPKRS